MNFRLAPGLNQTARISEKENRAGVYKFTKYYWKVWSGAGEKVRGSGFKKRVIARYEAISTQAD